MNAVELLADEHRSINERFAEFEAGSESPADREDIVRRASAELREHASGEEELLYAPLAEAAAQDPVVELSATGRAVDLARAEHNAVEMLVLELEGMTHRDKDFEAKFSVLIDTARAHMQREEVELLPLARRILGDNRLSEIGDALAARFDERP